MYRKFIGFILIALLVLVPSGGALLAAEHEEAAEYEEAAGYEEAARDTTLREVIQHVLETHPEVKAAAYARLARDWEVVQSWSAFFPTIDGSMAWGTTKQERPTILDDKTWPKRRTIGARQNVFRGGANLADVNRQKERVKSQAYLVRAASDNMALLTARVYMNFLRNIELKELADENLTNHERIADQVRLRIQSGVDARAELDQVMGRLALAKSNVVVTSANLADSITDYYAVVGLYPGDLAGLEALDVLFPDDIVDAESFALRNNPVVKSANADLEARKNQYRTAQRLLSPSVDLAADYNRDRNVAPVDGRRHHWAATATVSMNFFSGGRDLGRIQETMNLYKEAEEILNNTRRQTVQSIRLSWEANQAAIERVVYLEEYVEAAQATAEAFATQWNLGRRTMFDLLDTQAEAINAKSDLARARYELLYSEYRVLNSMGSLVYALGLEYPEEGFVKDDTGLETKAFLHIDAPEEYYEEEMGVDTFEEYYEEDVEEMELDS